jgi:hypothetical protein
MRLFFIDINRNYATQKNQLRHMTSRMKYDSNNHYIYELSSSAAGLAAIGVYIFQVQHLSGNALPFFGQFGSEVVIIMFFVLSSLLISYAREKMKICSSP